MPISVYRIGHRRVVLGAVLPADQDLLRGGHPGGDVLGVGESGVAKVLDVRAGIGAVECVVIEIVVRCHIDAVILGGGAELIVQRHRGQTQLATVGVEQLDEGPFLPSGRTRNPAQMRPEPDQSRQTCRAPA